MINPSSVTIPGVSMTSVSAVVPGHPGSNSSMWINKLKIVGSGQNWAVAPCEPFYLMGTESLNPDINALTGAKNLIEHYGLENAYQKFCGRRVKEELSAFLPHLSGNVDVPASTDGSGLMHLIERPPIRGKDIRTFAPVHLEQAFRLHPGPLPQEYMSLFAAAPSASSSTSKQEDISTSQTGSNASRNQPSTASGYSQPQDHRRRRRYEVHRGLQAVASGGTPGTFGISNLTPPSTGFFPSAVANQTTPSTLSSGGSGQSQQPTHTTLLAQTATATPTGRSNNAPSGSVPPPPPPGLIHIASGGAPPSVGNGSLSTTSSVTCTSGNQSSPAQSSLPHPPPPPPLLAPVHLHQSAQPSTRSGASSTSTSAVTGSNQGNLPAPPLLHSIHNAAPPHQQSSSSIVDGVTGTGHDWSSLPSSPPPAIAPGSPLEGLNHDGGLQELPTLTVGDEERRRRRKEKRRRRDRD